MPEIPFAARVDVALYPRWWRDRYADDQQCFMADLRSEGRSVARAVPDLVAGAVRARISGTGAPSEPGLWWARTRASVATSTLPVMLLMPVMVVATARGFYGGGSGELSTAARVANDAASVLFLALVATLLVLVWGWAVLLGQASDMQRGPGRWRYGGAVGAPAVAVGGALVLSTVASHLGAGAVTGASWRWSAARHAFYDISIVRGPGNPLLVSSLREAALVCAIGGWMIAAVAVTRAARRAPITYDGVRSGVLISRVVAVCAAVLAAAFAVFELAIVLQPWHASHLPIAGCSGIPPVAAIQVLHGCTALSAPAGHAVLTSPLAGMAPLWIALAVVAAGLSVVGARAARRSLRSALELELELGGGLELGLGG
jgi:hypothetical protein